MYLKLMADYCKGLELGYAYSDETMQRNREFISNYYSDSTSYNPLRNIPYVALLCVLYPVNIILKVVTFPYLLIRDFGKSFTTASNYDAYFDGTIREIRHKINSFDNCESQCVSKGDEVIYLTTSGTENLGYADPAIIRYMIKEKLLNEKGANIRLEKEKEDSALRKELEEYLKTIKE